jgi:NAD(P)-dependent dehydrogenase (short-subunit alcohol dehydrogenase family)
VKTFAEQNGSIIHHLVNGGHCLENLLLKRSHAVHVAACFVSRGLDATLNDFNKSYQTNVCGYAFMAQAVYPYMKNAGGKLL